MTTLTDKQLASLARVLGVSAIAEVQSPDAVWVSHIGGVPYRRIGSDWDLIGALLMKLRERQSWALHRFTFEESAVSDVVRAWFTPADLLAAIADACEEEK